MIEVLLRQRPSPSNAASQACRVGSLRVMRILHEKDKSADILEQKQAGGARARDIRTRDLRGRPKDFGWTPIVEACRNAHYRAVEQMVTWNASVRADERGAARCVVARQLDLAQVSHEDFDGDTPLDHASDPWYVRGPPPALCSAAAPPGSSIC